MILLALLLAAGCAPAADQPPAIRYGQDQCAECRMILAEPRFAAATVDARGEPQKFDDIGCMVLHQAESPAQNARAWVHDAQGASWLDADRAVFVQAPAIVTPMGYGFVACNDRAEAQALAAKTQGSVVDRDAMLKQIKRIVLHKGEVRHAEE